MACLEQTKPLRAASCPVGLYSCLYLDRKGAEGAGTPTLLSSFSSLHFKSKLCVERSLEMCTSTKNLWQVPMECIIQVRFGLLPLSWRQP